jgi:type VI secretion system secreted protein VgrG
LCRRFYQLGETCWRHLLAEASDIKLMLVPSLDTLLVMDTFTESGSIVEWGKEGGLTAFEVSANMQNGNRSGVNYDREGAKSKIFQSVVTDKPQILGAMPDLCDVMFGQATAPAALGGRELVNLLREEAGAELELKQDSKQAVLRTVIGRGQCTDPTISPGFSLEVTGNPLFTGKWGLIEVVHHWTSAGYANDFTCIPFNEPFAPEPPQLAPMTLPVHCRVVSTPVNTDRIQVQMPWEEDSSVSLFFPWLSPYTGAGRGVCFPPEIGDEVLVQFVNGDGSAAYIVSGAWNGVDQPPLDKLFGNERDQNDIKRIVTKSGNRLVMDDKDGKEAIVMATPNHVRVSLFDGGSTMVLHSDGDIHINAGGTVHMKCKQYLREVG